jgi:hypothetical protein
VIIPHHLARRGPARSLSEQEASPAGIGDEDDVARSTGEALGQMPDVLFAVEGLVREGLVGHAGIPSNKA